MVGKTSFLLAIILATLFAFVTVAQAQGSKTGWVCKDGEVSKFEKVGGGAKSITVKTGQISYQSVDGNRLVINTNSWYEPADKVVDNQAACGTMAVVVVSAAGPMPTSFVAPPLPTPAAHADIISREVVWPSWETVAKMCATALGIVLIINLFRRR